MGRLIARCAVWGVGILLVLVALFPLLWALLNSLKTLLDIVTPRRASSLRPRWRITGRSSAARKCWTGLTNSAVIVGSAVLLGTLMGVPAAYVIARYHVPGKRDIQFFLLSLRFLPPVAVAIPLIAIWVDLGLYDTRFSMIVTYLLTTLDHHLAVDPGVPAHAARDRGSRHPRRLRPLRGCSGRSPCPTAPAPCWAESSSASCWSGTS
jgi:multiple sugar transport system permease protein